MPVITYIIYPHIWLKAGVISRLFTSFFICIFDSFRLYRRCCCSDLLSKRYKEQCCCTALTFRSLQGYTALYGPANNTL